MFYIVFVKLNQASVRSKTLNLFVNQLFIKFSSKVRQNRQLQKSLFFGRGELSGKIVKYKIL